MKSAIQDIIDLLQMEIERCNRVLSLWGHSSCSYTWEATARKSLAEFLLKMIGEIKK